MEIGFELGCNCTFATELVGGDVFHFQGHDDEGTDFTGVWVVTEDEGTNKFGAYSVCCRLEDGMICRFYGDEVVIALPTARMEVDVDD